MTYTEALNYIHSLSRFGIKPGLERVTALLELVNNPQDALDFVHVAGTNGKGSTCTMLAYGLSGTGYKTGLYTSPYVLEFRERIQLSDENGNFYMIPEEDLARITEILIPLADKVSVLHGEITEFEFITALAFFWFAEQEADIVVLETGLGGRFDATNVIKSPLCSVITTISLDHTDILGDTVPLIAAEKCGIIKEGCPVVSTYLQSVDALDVIYSACESKKCRFDMPSERQIGNVTATLKGSELEYFGKSVSVPFAGEHQIANGLTALTVAFTLRDVHGFDISNGRFLKGMARVRIPARQEVLRSDPLLLLDGSHNPDGLFRLSQTVKTFLTEEGKPKKNSLLIIGMLRDKDVKSSVSLVTPYFERVVTVTPDSPRAMTNEELATIIEGSTPMTVEAAASLARENDGVTVICGSLYLASEIREMLIV